MYYAVPPPVELHAALQLLVRLAVPPAPVTSLLLQDEQRAAFVVLANVSLSMQFQFRLHAHVLEFIYDALFDSGHW